MPRASKNEDTKSEAGTAVIDMNQDLKDQIANQQKMLSKITTAANFISFKGGQITIDKKIVPNAMTDVVVLAFMGERTYFPGAFDPDSKQSPVCYAYYNGLDDDEVIKPHKSIAKPIAKTCAECEFNKWGSAEVGRGKACRESIRVAVVPAVKDMAKAQLVHARVPITSVPAFKMFASDMLSSEQPIWGAVTELSVTPDAKTFFKIHWNVKRGITKAEAPILLNRARAAEQGISFEYPQFDEEPASKAKPKPVKGSKAKR